jgi:cell division transport system permease protein
MLFSESLRSMTSNLSTTMAATLTVLIGMFLVGVLLAFGTWARSWSDAKKGELVVKVYLCTDLECGKKSGPEATPAQKLKVRNELVANPLVKTVTFVSKADGLAKMRKEQPDIVRALQSNPLPDSFEVTPHSGENTTEIGASIQKAHLAGVDEVMWGQKTTSRVLQLAHVIESVFLFAVAILLIAAMILIANTIRLSIFSRRREIEVMKLVGASNWFVRGPFMLEGLLCGLIGSVLAVVLQQVARDAVAAPNLDELDAAEGAHAIAFGLNALILCGLGLLIGAFGSGLTVRRFLKV